MVYVQEKPSLEGIEFDDERVIIAHLFDESVLNNTTHNLDDLNYPNTSLTQHTHNLHTLNMMPEVYRVARVLLGKNLG